MAGGHMLPRVQAPFFASILGPSLTRNNVKEHRLITGAEQSEVVPPLPKCHVVGTGLHIWPVSVNAIVLPETDGADVIFSARFERVIIAARALEQRHRLIF
jgi:hypothetical protein